MLWTPARNEGITSVVAVPSGGLIAGQAAFLDTSATRARRWCGARRSRWWPTSAPRPAEAKSRGELLMRLRELLDDARDLRREEGGLRAGGDAEFVGLAASISTRCSRCWRGGCSLLVAVDRASDIEALRSTWRAEYRLKVIVQGGAEAWKVAPALAAAKVPVLVSGQDNIPTTFDALGARQENAALLRKRRRAVSSSPPAPSRRFNVRNVKQHAGNAVAYGLPWDDALRAVTLTPAEVFGVADTVGSLAVGKAANVVVWSGDPFEFATRAEHVFVRGVERVERSRQDLLTERYKTPRD